MGTDMLSLQNTILEMVARGASLEATADRLCREVEAMVPGVICSIVTVDRSNLLHPLAGPCVRAMSCSILRRMRN